MEKRNFGMGFGVIQGWMVAVVLFIFLPIHTLYGQSGSCDPTTPFFVVDLSASPGGTWTSPNVSRSGNCCGTNPPDRCIEFEIHLHPSTVAVNFNIASGAIPPGAMFYQIDCGPQIPVGQPICITGPGPHTLTFCKPGNNPNTYAIEAIPNPEVSPPIIASQVCPGQLWVQGLVPTSIHWYEITSGTGAYNAFLSCTNCPNPTVTPSANPPAYVDYVVCGTVAAPACSGIINFCDTVRVYMFAPIQASVTPNPVVICNGNPFPTVTATASGGWGNLTYTWYNSSSQQVGSGQQWTPTSPGNYVLVVTDQAYPNCPGVSVPLTVISQPQPSISISPALPGICEGSSVTLTASGASTYQWSPQTGLVQINNNQVVASPSSTTTYTVTGVDNNGCSNTASVTVQVFPLPNVDAGPDQTICEGQSAQLQGSGAWLYQWTPAATLNNPNIPNPIATPTTTTTYYLTGYSLGQNIIFNGDFEQGNIGFVTDYVYSNNLIPEGNYYITNNPRNTHPNFAQCQDHTPNPGNLMMVINGAPVPNQRVWCQTVQVTPNTDYVFSTWITSVHPLNPAVLQFSINGVLLGTPFTATSAICTWQQFYQTWNSGMNTSAEICIVNQNTIRNGNDFALDDISFAPLCSNVDSVTVYVNPRPQITVANDTICQGETAQLQASSNVPNTSFLWSTGFSGNPLLVTPTTTTSYSVTGTANGCSGSTSASVVVHPVPTVNITASATVICEGETTTLTATSSIPGSTFAWSTGNNTPSITVSPNSTNTYTVTVTTPDQCSNTAQITITVNPTPTLTVSATSSTICEGNSTTLNVSSSVPGSTFIWSTGDNTSSITVSPNTTTTYTVTATTPNQCSNSSQITITVHPTPVVTLTATNSTICDGSSTTINATSTVPGSSFMWSTGDNTSTITVSPSNTTTYTVTVTTPDFCSNSAQITITVNPTPTLTLSATSPSICDGESTTINVISSVPGTSYIWSTGDNTSSITISPNNTTTYTVTATTPDQCSNSAQITITVNPTPVISLSTNNPVICQGQVSIISASSTVPVTYQWSSGQSGNVNGIVVTPAATTTYSVTGTTANQCSGSAEITIVVNPTPNVTLSATNPIICEGESTSITASSSVPGSAFIWSTGDNTSSITVSPNNTTTYSVTVTTPEQCSNFAQITITVNPTPSVSVSTTTPIICDGQSTTINATSSVAGSSFIWSTGDNTPSITVNPNITTTYAVTATTPEQCTNSAEVTITVNPTPTVTVSATSPTICDGESTTITASSSVPGSTFNWSTGENTTFITVNPSNTTTYVVTVTTPDQCSNTAQITINVNPTPIISLNSNHPVICQGQTTTISASSTVSVSYQWNTGQSGNINGIVVSPATTTTYSVTGTTANQCSGSAEITIVVNPTPTVNVSATNPTICDGESTTINVTSSVQGSTYLWSTGDNTASITVSPSNTTTYTVTATTPEQCMNTAQITITVNPTPTVTLTATNSTICEGTSTTIIASSSIPGSNFLWSTGDNTSTITVSPNNTTTYSVTATTPEQCSNFAQLTITVNPIPSITITVSDQEICQGESVTIQATSNDPSATFAWNTGANNALITDQPLVTTNYIVTVTSSQQCTNTAEILVTVNQNPSAIVTASSTAICEHQSTTLEVQTNIPITSITWSTGETDVSTIQVSPTTTSTYGVTVTTPQQCSSLAEITIQVHPLPVIQIQTQNEEVCEGLSTSLVASSNHPNTSFVWNTGSQGNSITVSPNQTTWYYVTGTDLNGCQAIDSIRVIVNPNPKISISPSSEEICDGFSITLTASSNHPNTSFVWNTGAQTATIVVTPSTTTTYSVTGTDTHGCTGSNRATIQVHPVPQLQLSSPPYTLCSGDTAILTVSTNQPATIQWNTGDTSPTIAVTPATTTLYSVTVTSSNGCSATGQLQVNVRPNPEIIVYPSNPRICFGDEITLVATGAHLYNWSPSSGLNTNIGSVVIASPSVTTTYVVEGIDLYGCKGIQEVVVDVRPIPNVNFTADMNQICMATTVRFSGTSDQPIQNWSWNFGDPNAGQANYGYSQNITHTFFSTGSYTITLEVISVDGCKNSITKPAFIVVHPNPIAAFYRTPDITTIDNATIQFFDQSIGHQKILWNFDDPSSGDDNISMSTNPTHTYVMAGEYWPTLYVENEWGCIDSVSNRVIVKNVSEEYIPSAFSPNGDGINDIFRPTGFNIDWTEYTMYIFDRWGNQIFTTTDIEKGWDGRVNGEGEIVQQDVYVYKIILKDSQGIVHEFIGHVTLIK